MTDAPNAANWFTLAAGERASQRSVRIRDRHCTGPRDRRFLFGGMGVALVGEALRSVTGGEVSAISLQFIEPTPVGSELVLEVARMDGRRFIQADVAGWVGDRLVMRGIASLRAASGSLSWKVDQPIEAPPPEACPVIVAHHEADQDVHSLLEMRLVRGRFGIFSKAPVSGDGCVRLWMRPAEGPFHLGHLALVADFVPSITSNALGVRSGGSSLDNTIRHFGMPEGQWVLAELAVHAIRDSVAHGSFEIRDETGAVLAIGGQSFVARRHASA
jgi:acyl-CoA thioesterase-2